MLREGGQGNQFPGWAPLHPCRRGGERSALARGAHTGSPSPAAMGSPLRSQGQGRVGFSPNTSPCTAATEGTAMLLCQFGGPLGRLRNHVTATQQMNSTSATALGWPYLHWASQECQDFSIHKKCTSGTNWLCHFSSAPQSQMIHIVRKACGFGLACVCPLHRFRSGMSLAQPSFSAALLSSE